MNRIRLFLIVTMGLMLTFSSVGCGSKKPKTGDPGDGPDGGLEDGMEPEANTGPVDYPEPPKVDPSNRNPVKFTVSVKRAHVLPLSEDGACWDSCATETKAALVESLGNLSGEGFSGSGKALKTAMNASSTADVLPDVYVHMDCGFGQEYTTSKASAENRVVARWQGAKETLKLDSNDFCSISVWDADDDDQDEKIGELDVQLLKATTNGEVVLGGADDFGQVVLLELFLDQHEGTPVWQGGGSQPGNTQPGTESQPQASTQPSTTPSPGSSTPAPAHPGQFAYVVEIVKANLKSKKEDGKPWDTKIPFVSGGTMPDPFVSAYVNGYKSPNPFMETSMARETAYHEWRETGTANLRPTDKIHFMVWDKDKVDHDLMGECITDPVGNLRLGAEIVIRNCAQVDFLVFKINKK